jgi:LytS/YehU family sensor histidine kinase
MIVFYTNYLFLIEKILTKKYPVRFLLVNCLLISVVVIGIFFWNDFFTKLVPGPGRPPFPIYISFLKDFLFLSLTAGLSVAIKVTANWYKSEQERKELEKERATAELTSLKSQLNPHFLFNTLNNIYSLATTDPPQAQYAILGLSRLLRYVLYENNHPEISLSQELSFVKSYIELMSLRLSKKVELKVNISDDLQIQNIMIAPLMFIVLIENAFKHGINPAGNSVIDIAVTIENGSRVKCRIENSYHPKPAEDKSGSGIGLSNLRKRLALIYPQRHRLTVLKDGEKYISELIIDI